MKLSYLYKNMASLLFLSTTTLISATTNAAETVQLATIDDAKVIKRVAPKYPINAARLGKEGSAKLSYVIDTKGNVSHVIVEDIIGYKGFAKVAKKAVSQWKFKPALEDGKPVQQCQNAVQLDFSMSMDGHKVSQQFYRLYKKTQRAFADNDLELVKKYLDKLTKLEAWKLADISYTNLLKAKYAQMLNKPAEQLKYLNKTGNVFQKDVYFSLLSQRYKLNIQFNNLYEANKDLEQMLKMEQAKPYLAKLKQQKQNIDDFIENGGDIVVDGTLNSEHNFWKYTLLRNNFSLLQTSGKLDEVDLRCANKRHIFKIGDDSQWNIPKKWQHCSVYISGDKNAVFKLVEHGNKQIKATTAAL